MTVPALDTHEFTRRADAAAGTVPLARMERLASLLLSTDGGLAWRLAGRSELGSDGSRRGFMNLEIAARPVMRCVRCLEPIEVEIAARRDYRMVGSEEQAEREDVDEDAFDLLVSSRHFDLAGLIEDEAIMALPPAPRHDGCRAPDAPALADDPAPAVGEPEARAGAFAALGALRKGRDTGGGPGGDR